MTRFDYMAFEAPEIREIEHNGPVTQTACQGPENNGAAPDSDEGNPLISMVNVTDVDTFDDHSPVADTSFADFLVQVEAGDDLDA